MIGYGAEDDHFVAELTYNYGIKSYKLGNAFQVSYTYVCICLWNLRFHKIYSRQILIKKIL